MALYDRINKGLWAALDRGEMKAEKLAVERFSRLGKELNRPLDAQQMSRAYLEQLAQHGDTVPRRAGSPEGAERGGHAGGGDQRV